MAKVTSQEGTVRPRSPRSIKIKSVGRCQVSNRAYLVGVDLRVSAVRRTLRAARDVVCMHGQKTFSDKASQSSPPPKGLPTVYGIPVYMNGNVGGVV